MKTINGIITKIKTEQAEIANYGYLDEVKKIVIGLLISIQLIMSSFLLIYGYFSGFGINGLVGQMLVIGVMLVLGFAYKKGISNVKLSVVITLFYSTVVVPGTWFGLGTNHFLPTMLSLFSAITIILFLEGSIRAILLTIYFVISAIMSTADMNIVVKEVGQAGAVGRYLSLLLSFTLICMMVWAFKSKLMIVSKKLYESSIRDNLTGAYNTVMLEHTLESWYELEASKDIIFAAAMIDMDNFKKVNDIYGHHEGDRALCDLTEHCQKYIGDQDLFIRYGGDEFVFLFWECDQAKATQILKRVLGEIHQVSNKYPSVGLSFSAGITDNLEAREMETDLLVLADKKMYAAKSKRSVEL